MHDGAVRITYRTKENFKQFSKALGIMDDFKSGVPRMAYRYDSIYNIKYFSDLVN